MQWETESLEEIENKRLKGRMKKKGVDEKSLGAR